jgi:hypothetical protein
MFADPLHNCKQGALRNSARTQPAEPEKYDDEHAAPARKEAKHTCVVVSSGTSIDLSFFLRHGAYICLQVCAVA